MNALPARTLPLLVASVSLGAGLGCGDPSPLQRVETPALRTAPEVVIAEHVATRPVDRPEEFWTSRHALLGERVRSSAAQILFVGDSITQGWEVEGAAAWERYYDGRHAVNLGISGDRTEHVLWRLERSHLDQVEPALAIVMIGTNNAGVGQTSDQIADGVTAVVRKLRAGLPETRVLLLAIFPRGEDASDPVRLVNERANERLARLADGEYVHYLDIGARFLGEGGTLPREVMPDLLHLSPRGYEIWAESIEPTVARLLAEE